jgi:hypothetical protein
MPELRHLHETHPEVAKRLKRAAGFKAIAKYL